MKHFFTVACLALIVCAVGCRLQDIRKDKISVPEMKNEACFRIVGAAIMKLPGLNGSNPKALTFNQADRTVTVEYDSMIVARKNIEQAIGEAGFAANDIPANSKAAAALPPECK